ncbi:MAG: thiamine pyrophosphokinase Thi80 [Rhodobacteraceae bacterium HLUCCA12]|nr:MAG: thiamine pyrophosphokinase Thi80 [Rhodobacteraceae bacterium HLUCCA12]
MTRRFTSTTGITLLGGGDLARGRLTRALALAPDLVAVDGGADHALAHGVTPRLALGDFDSISAAARRTLGAERLLHLPSQDDTDFDKALAMVDAPLILALGFTGARLDHTLAGMSTLVRNPQARVIVDSGADLCFLAPPRLNLALTPGSRLSLFPLAPLRCESAGLVWPTSGLAFDPAGLIGTSNTVTQGPVSLVPERPAMLVMVPAEALDAVIAALRQAPAWAGSDRAR